jgi:hypothetical protein
MGGRLPIMGNNRIRKSGFSNQYSLFGLDLEKMFFALGPEIFLQHYRPKADIQIAWANVRFRGYSGHRPDMAFCPLSFNRYNYVEGRHGRHRTELRL